MVVRVSERDVYNQKLYQAISNAIARLEGPLMVASSPCSLSCQSQPSRPGIFDKERGLDKKTTTSLTYNCLLILFVKTKE